MNVSILESLGLVGFIICFLALLCSVLFVERISHINKVTLDTPGFIDGIINLLKLNLKLESV